MNIDKQKVFLVDDSLSTLDQGEALLERYFDVMTMGCAKKLFEILEKITPDIILLDVMMPEMDGFETIKILKADPRWRDIPVMFLTGKNDSESESLGFALGAVDYIVKPFSGPLLQKRIANQISHRKLQTAIKDYSVNYEDTLREIVITSNKLQRMISALPPGMLPPEFGGETPEKG